MQFLDIDFFLAKEQHAEALAAMKQVDLDLISEHAFIGWNDQDESMARTLERLQEWNLPKNTSLKQALKQAPSIEVFLGLLDYGVDYDDEGNIIGLEWTGNYWQKYTHACLEAIAPYVMEGSYIEADLDQGHLYRWEFTDKKLLEKNGHTVWE